MLYNFKVDRSNQKHWVKSEGTIITVIRNFIQVARTSTIRRYSGNILIPKNFQHSHSSSYNKALYHSQSIFMNWLIFDSLSTCPGLFYTETESYIHTFFVLLFLKGFFFSHSSIWAIDETLTKTTTLSQSEPESNGIKRVLHTLQIFSNWV